MGSDGRLEVDVPSAALTAADLGAAGGAVSLLVRQIDTASGSSAGGSGHVSFGAYLLQIVDSQGHLLTHGLRKSVTLTMHLSARDGAVDLRHAFVLENASLPDGVNLNPDPLGASLTRSAARLGAPTKATLRLLTSMASPGAPGKTSSTATSSPQLTLSASVPLSSPTTTASFSTNSPVATFGKPDPFNVDLSAGSLTSSVPIDVPPGPGGSTPHLALGYSSAAVSEQHNPQGAAPWVGEAWSLSPGSISWSQRSVTEGNGTTSWEDSWQLSDPFGSAVELIPPNINVSTYYEDANGQAITPSPVTWHTAPENHAKVISFTPPVSNATPAAVSWGTGRIDLFIRGTDNKLYHRWYTNTAWSSWQLVATSTSMTSSPTATSWGPNRLDVFARGQDNALWQITSTDGGATWGSWVRIGGTLTSDPSAVSWGLNRIDVVANGSDSAAYHISTTDGGAHWSAWGRLGGTLSASPAISSWGPSRLDVFGRGQDNALYQQTSTDGSTFTSWQFVGGNLNSGPAAVAWGTNHIDAFARGQDLALYQNTYNGSAWSGWAKLDGSLNGGPGVASWGSGHLDVFASGQDGGLYRKTYDSSVWTGWELLTRGQPTGMAAIGPCFRVFLPNGIMEEYGCTPDSFQFYPEPTGPNTGLDYVSAWLLDLVVDAQGNQIHYTYQQDLETGAGGHQYPRDAVLSTVEYDSPSCVNTTSACPPNDWKPLMRVNFVAAHAAARLGGNSTCIPGSSNGTLRCDDPIDLTGTGGLAAPTIQNTFVLNDIQVQVRATSTGPWNTLRHYQLGYDQFYPSTVTEPVTGLSQSTAGRLTLDDVQLFGDDGSTNQILYWFGYTQVTQYYEDDAHHPAPSTNCGPPWNTGTGTGCLLWNQSYGGNSYYLSSSTSALGLQQNFSWANARNNTHGANGGGSNNSNPLACTTQNTYPCNEADDQEWSHAVLTAETDTASAAGTTSYNYVLASFTTRACSDCLWGYSWGNRNDNDYLDYYNDKFFGFLQTNVTHPDGSQDVNNFYASEGWGVYDTSQVTTCIKPGTCQPSPWWDLPNAAHGHPYEIDVYKDSSHAWPLHQTNYQYNVICPPKSVSGTPPSSTWGNWDSKLVSALDHNNPVASCDVQTARVDEAAQNGSPGYAQVKTTTYTYDGDTYAYGRVTRESNIANDGPAGSARTIVQNPTYALSDTVIATPVSASGSYLVSFPKFTDTEDSGGIQYQCHYLGYDGQTPGNGIITTGLVTQADQYADCGTNAQRLTTTYAYDVHGNVLGTKDPNANAGRGSQRCSIGANTYTSCEAYDTTFAALPTSTTNAFNHVGQTGYDSSGLGGFGTWPVSTTDANGQTVSVNYDPLGRRTATILPGDSQMQHTTDYAYTDWCGPGVPNPCVEIDSVQRFNGSTTVTSRAFHDGFGNLVESRSPAPSGNDVIRYSTYDGSDRLVSQSIPYFVSAYTGAPGSAAFAAPDLNQPHTTFVYDGLGRVVSMTDALGKTTTNQIASVCGAAGTDATCYEQITTVDPLGHQSAALVDALGQTAYVQRYTGTSPATNLYATTAYAYDPAGRLIQITQPAQGPPPPPPPATTFRYDTAGRQTSTTDPDLGTVTDSYDQNGNVIQSVDARGASGTIYTGYDELNRPTYRNATTNSLNGAYATFTYDAGSNGLDRLTGESFIGGPNSTLSGSYSYGYDGRGQQTSRTLTVTGGPSSPYVVGTSYDDAGNILTQGYPTGETVTTGYTSQGWLTSLSTTQGNTSLLSGATYSQGTNQYGGPAGQITAANLGGSTYQYSATYDALGRATDLKWTNGSTTRFEQTRSFDPAGNVTTANTTMPAGTDNQAFCYDEQNRLTWAGSTGTPPCQSLATGTLTPAYTQTFAYDNLGRISNTTGTGGYSGPTGTYTYGDTAHLHAATGINGTSWSAAYDAAGNMCARALGSGSVCSGTKSGAQLSVDAEGRLSAWQDAPNPTTSDGFLYDNQGSRIEQQVTQGGTTTTTVYVGSLEQISKIGTAQATQTTYYYAGSARVALAVNGVFSYLAADSLGSADVVLSANGTVMASALYAPYGGLRYSSGAMPTDYGFTGQHADAVTGLDYYNARYYDPLAGQFSSADSVLQGGGYDVFGLSRYAYVDGNPEMHTDPSGNFWLPPSRTSSSTDAFSRGVAGFGMGLVDSVTGTIGGLWDMAQHPVRTAWSLGILSFRVATEGVVPVAAPIVASVAKSVWRGLSSSDPYTRGHMIGLLVGNFALAAVGTKGLGLVSGLGRVGGVARAAEAGQVAYGSTELSQIVLEVRVGIGGSLGTGGNFAAARLANGETLLGRSSAEMHAEEDILSQAGGRRITGLYSEREPCAARCQGLIPDDTNVSWSFQWNPPGVRAASNDALNAAIRALFGG